MRRSPSWWGPSHKEPKLSLLLAFLFQSVCIYWRGDFLCALRKELVNKYHQQTARELLLEKNVVFGEGRFYRKNTKYKIRGQGISSIVQFTRETYFLFLGMMVTFYWCFFWWWMMIILLFYYTVVTKVIAPQVVTRSRWTTSHHICSTCACGLVARTSMCEVSPWYAFQYSPATLNPLSKGWTKSLGELTIEAFMSLANFVST